LEDQFKCADATKKNILCFLSSKRWRYMIYAKHYELLLDAKPFQLISDDIAGKRVAEKKTASFVRKKLANSSRNVASFYYHLLDGNPFYIETSVFTRHTLLYDGKQRRIKKYTKGIWTPAEPLLTALVCDVLNRKPPVGNFLNLVAAPKMVYYTFHTDLIVTDAEGDNPFEVSCIVCTESRDIFIELSALHLGKIIAKLDKVPVFEKHGKLFACINWFIGYQSSFLDFKVEVLKDMA